MTNTTTTQNGAGQTTTNDARPLNELTEFQRDLLRTILVSSGPGGVDIRDAIRADYGEEIGHARPYMTLDGLVENGLVEKGEADGRTNTYTLTECGARERAAHLEWATGERGSA